MTARGIRLNNPGNVRLGLQWQGMADIQNDKEFITFATPEYGIRAMAKVLMTYQKRYLIDTISACINRYAPPSENNTIEYIRDVCNRTGFTSTDQLDFTDSDVLAKLIYAIIHHEEGCDPYNATQIRAGVALTTNQKEDDE